MTSRSRAASILSAAVAGLVIATPSLASAAPMATGAPVAADGSDSSQAASSSAEITVGASHDYAFPDDTPAAMLTDADGSFHAQSAHALYAKDDPREWLFFKGTNIDDMTADKELNAAADPDDPTHRNDDTTVRCNQSPTGKEASKDPTGSYSQKNFCDLVGVWVDPDSGDWIGIVHNEFTGRPFGDGLHYDSLDYAVSTDSGKTWDIKDHIITSPYSTKRGDEKQFPEDTYNYGDGDPRLFVDTASGYFYVYYGSRVIGKQGKGGENVNLSHVARAPISKKMAPGSWAKFYDGSFSQKGLGGKESNLTPVTDRDAAGYTAPEDDYDPTTPGNTDAQVKAGELPGTSPLFVMNISYDAHLGLYIGQPEGATRPGPQEYYATDDLTSQKWHLLGTGDDQDWASWYRWMVDSKSLTSGNIIGKDFRSYCSISCTGESDGEYFDVSIDSEDETATEAQNLFSTKKAYTLSTGRSTALGQQKKGQAKVVGTAKRTDAGASWTITPTGDGAYTIANTRSGALLGVDSTRTKQRAWGTKVKATEAAGEKHGKRTDPSVGQQWWVVRDTDPATGERTGTYHLVNRYSGLVLDLEGSVTSATTDAADFHGSASTADEGQSLKIAVAKG